MSKEKKSEKMMPEGCDENGHDEWYHEKEMEMIGEFDEESTKGLIKALKGSGYEFPYYIKFYE